jgi:hypothetical protein
VQVRMRERGLRDRRRVVQAVRFVSTHSRRPPRPNSTLEVRVWSTGSTARDGALRPHWYGTMRRHATLGLVLFSTLAGLLVSSRRVAFPCRMSRGGLDWRSLLRDPSLLEVLGGQNEYLDAFVRVHRTIDWPKHLEERPRLIRRYSWALPTDEALETIARYAPIVEVGAGGGYWAHLLRTRGVDLVAYDRERPHDENYFARQSWTHVDPGGPSALRRHGDRSLFLCWPPSGSAMATNCLKAWTGTYLIHIGEWRNSTASRGFYDRLEAGFERVEEVALPQWEGICDALSVWRRACARPG